jgi:uncharacterized repeat protein (TIGR01451 family)
LIVATPSNLNNGCGGALTTPGSNSISLVNGSLAANASCTIKLDLQVTATTAGVLTSPAVILSSNQAPNATAAAINLTVTVPAPTFTMAFAPNPLGPIGPAPVTGSGTLTFTITNNAANQLTNLAFSHTLPAGLSFTGPSSVLPSGCGTATLSDTNGDSLNETIGFTGGPLATGQICTVTISVQTGNLAAPGTYTYPNSPVTLTNAQAAPATAGPVTWTVEVN